jgi:mannose-6-phosphate isomerase-like protein (cupin superfamily)
LHLELEVPPATVARYCAAVANAGIEILRARERDPLTPPDGSEVHELARPPDLARNQSLAEARVAPGSETVEHFHRTSEEIYYFLEGSGRMRLGDATAAVEAGEAVVIPPGTRHKVWNAGAEPLVFLCCCSPPYSDDDTVLCE